MVDTIRPILAAELETEVRVQNEEMGRRLISLQDQFEALQSKHRALLLEMERSRKEFERKKAEWQTLKELISKKNNLKGLLSTTDITHRYISGVTTVDVAIETDQLLVGNLEPSLSSKDKLDDLIGLVDSDSIISDSNSEPFPPSRKVNKEASPATKLAPVAPEKLGSTSMLKHGQAKDCTCCSKVYIHLLSHFVLTWLFYSFTK